MHAICHFDVRRRQRATMITGGGRARNHRVMHQFFADGSGCRFAIYLVFGRRGRITLTTNAAIAARILSLRLWCRCLHAVPPTHVA